MVIISPIKGREMIKKFRWKLVDVKGKLISKHFTKKEAEKAQVTLCRVDAYLVKI